MNSLLNLFIFMLMEINEWFMKFIHTYVNGN
jgi:hypothetical protein